MLCTLINPATDAAWTGDLDCRSVEWTALASGLVGAAELRFAPDHPAVRAGCLLPLGGSLVRLHAGELGRWDGVSEGPAASASGVTVAALEMAARLSEYRVGVSVLTARPAGMVALLAVKTAMGALAKAPIRIGTIADTPPVVADYAFNGQSVGAVLADMAARSGCEPRLRDGVFDFLPPDIGQVYPHLLCDGPDLSSFDEEAAEDAITAVTALGSHGFRHRATLPDAEGYREREAKITVASSSLIRLRRETESYVVARARPSRAARVALRRTPNDDPADPRRHWRDIREGDLVTALKPRDATGRSSIGRYRVLSRRFEEASGRAELSLFPVEAATAGIRMMGAYVEQGEAFSPTQSAYSSLAAQLAALQRGSPA